MGPRSRRWLNQSPIRVCEFGGFEAAPRSAPMDDLCLVKAVDRLGERIVVRVSDTSDGRLDAYSASRSEYLIETYWTIAVVDGTATMNGTPIMKRLLQSVEDKPGMRCPAHPPPERVDDGGT